MKLKEALAAIVTLLLSASVQARNLTPRNWATGTITPIGTQRLQNITNFIGGNQTTDTAPNFGMIIYNAVAGYADSMGLIAYVILFAVPFIMMVIVGADMTLPAIVGMVFSIYVFARLPAQYIMIAVGFFVISVASLLWSLYRRAY